MNYYFSKLYSALFLSIILISMGCSNEPDTTDAVESSGYNHVEGDPMDVRIYTLDNGLKIYLSVNKAEPRIQTNIAVRTGSKQDPADATGLAHYLEHMLFKGTSNLGSLNWEEEKVLLKMISDLYEEHRNTKDEEQRKKIYSKIDSISGLAAKYVATNEYDKLISGLGAQGTNAYTSNERTVYINDIPATELEKWLRIESERFSELVLRLFHTELEAVYEEFNRAQDNDFRIAYYKLIDELFPKHPYGQQTTIGTSEHLKNPSMEKIHEYFSKRYAPNNMAIVLAGDLDPEKTVALIDKYFGGMERREIEEPQMPVEDPITEPIIKQVNGSDAAFEMVAFRLDGCDSKDAIYAPLFDGILSNGTAGLIDLNLVQKQKVLRARVGSSLDKDYGMFTMSGYARDGQSLEEVRNLMLAQIDSVKQGNFEDWMLSAVIRDMKKSQMVQMEYNWIRAYLMSDAFILEQDWETVVRQYDEMEKVTKDELVAWANEKFKDNYVAVDKLTGEKDVVRVEKPQITPVDINRDTNSSFFKEIEAMESGRLEPQFLDFDKMIEKSTIANKVPVHYVENETNDLFYMYYVLDMGSFHNPKLPLAVKYLPYLGTVDMSPADVQKELFRLGLSFDVNTSEERVYITLNGLEETFEEGVKFFENLLANVVADDAAYDQMVAGMMKERADAKLSKRTILFQAMADYAKYGPSNPFNDIIPESELKSTDPQELIDLLRSLTSYEHRINFYGPQSLEQVTSILSANHILPETLMPLPKPKEYPEIATDKNMVYFIDYDMVQAEVYMLHRGGLFDKDLAPESKIFGEYFGSGLSSIVFQEIRESKALAYSAFAGFSLANEVDEHNYVRGYLGTQANKLSDATAALLDLMNNLPRADKQFNQAKTGALKAIETNRVAPRSIIWTYESAKRRGLDYDINSEIYPAIEAMEFDALQAFFDSQIKGKTFTYLVIGKESTMDMEALKTLGPVKVLKLEEVFGY